MNCTYYYYEDEEGLDTINIYSGLNTMIFPHFCVISLPLVAQILRHPTQPTSGHCLTYICHLSLSFRGVLSEELATHPRIMFWNIVSHIMFRDGR